MFWNKNKIGYDDLNDLLTQIEKLWEAHANMAMLVKNMSDLMRKMAEGMHANREDLDYLAQQTLKIAETQTKIVSHLSGKQMEDYLTRDFQGTVH